MNVHPVPVTPARSMIVPVKIQGVSITWAVMNALTGVLKMIVIRRNQIVSQRQLDINVNAKTATRELHV